MKLLSLCCAALAVAGCAQQVPPSLLAANDATQGLRNTRSASVTHDARDYKIIEPLEWQELNRRVTPKGSGK
jgi:hypothetical protein